jgi:alanyl-tRNA synthetase
MKTDEIREKYLAFFESKGHTRKPSDVLVPTWDPSVLFTPAGMNQFKDHFLGKVKLDFTKATTCQKCLRTGDIDNVGRTAYHHTFFEMLGNFSFGDYFKREAIHWAWEFLTGKQWMAIDPNRLSVTVYLDDDEAADIWHSEIGLPTSRIERLGEDENFWPASAPSQGPDGVCGPCSEIYVKRDIGKPVEVWNLVFTQFNRVGNPPNNLKPLPSKNIDTGMGLERMASVMQGVETNYHIDILRPIVEAAGDLFSIKYDSTSDNGRRLRRITDHVRAGVFAIHEHVVPGANKQKYVIRRLLRRAVLDGHQMGAREPFLYKLVGIVAEMMKNPYPELQDTIQRVANTIKAEEENFLGTLDAGLSRIERVFNDMSSNNRLIVSGKEGAELYQTYGVPPELLEQMAVEKGYTFDWPGFHHEMEIHGTISGKPQGVLFKTGPIESLKKSVQHTEFVGYQTTESPAEVKGIVATLGDEERLCDTLSVGETSTDVKLVLDKSPFYAESGGQVGDVGEVVGPGFKFQVTDTQKDGDLIVHFGKLTEGKLTAGAKVTAKVDVARRNAIRRAHSATHILHYALQKNLGKHAQQQGSKVEPDAFRFDFTNLSPIEAGQLQAIESDVLARVAGKEAVSWKLVPLTEARAAGAMMLFGEKYPDPVRMVSMGEFSRELCGGTHLDNTSEVEAFEIVSEEGVSAGTRRIVAYTGERAKQYERETEQALLQAAETLGCDPIDVPSAARRLAQQVRDLKKDLASGGKSATEKSAPFVRKNAKISTSEAKSTLRETARLLNVAPFDVPARVKAMQAEAADLQKQIERLAQSGTLSADSLLEKAETVGGAKLIVVETPGANPNLMRQWIDQIRQKAGSSAVMFLSAQGDDKVVLVGGISRDLVAKGLSAGNWVQAVAPVVGGGGGGKPDLAQAGGKEPGKIGEALAKAREVALGMLKST